MKRLVGLLLAVAATAPSMASDFSKLTEPAFGRSMLISAVRERQKECAGLGLYWAERGQSPGKNGAKQLADAVVVRLTVEIGDGKLARELVDGKAASYADPTRTEPIWTEARDYLTQKCEPYFAAARQGDSELATILGPVPTELLQLPSEEQCLATADYAKETGLGHWDEEVGELLRKERFHNVDAKERGFFFLPFMHSEDLTDQNRCVALYQAAADENLKYAEEHRDIIKRFGRFPHRNDVLGRATTAEEQAFLDGGGFKG